MIPYGRQHIDEEDIRAVSESLLSEYLTTGPLVEKFETELAKVTGAPTFVVNSGTAALHAAYVGIGLQQGDEVITPPNTFISTQATAIQLGATIVMADIEPETGLMSPAEVEKLISHKTRAIVLVDYAGQPCDVDQFRQIIGKRQIKIVQDAAHSFGSLYKGKPVGSLADVTTFSFYPTKNITTGEGGAVSSLNPEVLKKARTFSRQGLVRSKEEFQLIADGVWHQEVHEFGLNYRLSDFQCALGLSQLKKLWYFKDRRTEISNIYRSLLNRNERIKLIKHNIQNDPMWHLFPIRVNAELRSPLFDYLRKSGVGVQVNYFPAHWHPALAKQFINKPNCPNSEQFYREEISLPMHVGLSDEDVNNISKLVLDFVSQS
jgi:dTDP-4-amino-4,6-dideoxygalactose transaminase